MNEYSGPSDKPGEPAGSQPFEMSGTGDASDEPDIPLSVSGKNAVDAVPEAYVPPPEHGNDLADEKLEAAEQPLSQAEVNQSFEAVMLHEKAADISLRITREIKRTVLPSGNDRIDPPSLPDREAPFGVEHFANTDIPADQTEAAVLRLNERAMRTYADNPHLIRRELGAIEDDGSPHWGWGINLDYKDERGHAHILVQNGAQIDIKFNGADGIGNRYIYEFGERNGHWVMRKLEIVADRDLRSLSGSMPAADEAVAKVDERNENIRFGQELRALTQERIAIVGPDEATYLDSIIATAKPTGGRQDSEIHQLGIRRQESPLEPDPLHAAWAAVELEYIALEYAQRHGMKPFEQLFVDRQVTLEATPASAAGPAMLAAKTVHMVPADYVSEGLDRQLLHPGMCTLTWESQLAAENNRVIHTGRLDITDGAGDIVHQEHYTHNKGDIREVQAFQVLFGRPL